MNYLRWDLSIQSHNLTLHVVSSLSLPSGHEKWANLAVFFVSMFFSTPLPFRAQNSAEIAVSFLLPSHTPPTTQTQKIWPIWPFFLCLGSCLHFLPLPMAVFLEFHPRLFSSTPQKIRPVWPRFFCTCHCEHAKHGCVCRVLPLCCSSLLPLKNHSQSGRFFSCRSLGH
jgi:hypothetical protein